MVFVIHVLDMLHMGINYLSDFTEMQKNGDGQGSLEMVCLGRFT